MGLAFDGPKRSSFTIIIDHLPPLRICTEFPLKPPAAGHQPDETKNFRFPEGHFARMGGL
ncbi:hypothetical protein OUZ56_009275 [Daphnia magna]|uniref:Uncharacterized protein n=1 Tax=Daphnia magna TaxID=35525 RepID=A0ABR0AFI8_9CRUS|nr:hypothetical protein OUZ56_009275 [Daphnia magna]